MLKQTEEAAFILHTTQHTAFWLISHRCCQSAINVTDQSAGNYQDSSIYYLIYMYSLNLGSISNGERNFSSTKIQVYVHFNTAADRPLCNTGYTYNSTLAKTFSHSCLLFPHFSRPRKRRSVGFSLSLFIRLLIQRPYRSEGSERGYYSRDGTHMCRATKGIIRRCIF